MALGVAAGKFRQAEATMGELYAQGLQKARETLASAWWHGCIMPLSCQKERSAHHYISDHARSCHSTNSAVAILCI